MWLCYLNGLDHAAVVTACALVELSVKSAVYTNSFVEADCTFDSAEWDRVESLQFFPLIAEAEKRGVITRDEWEQLDWLRKHIRNVYMHGAAPNWLKDQEAEGVVVGDLETGDVSEQNIKLRDDLTLQRQYRIAADRNACNEVIPLADHYARTLARRSLERLEAWKAANPSKPTIDQVQRVIANMQKQGLEADRPIIRDIPDELRAPKQSSTET